MLIRKRLIDKTTRLAPIGKAVAHRFRLAILYLLAHDPKETFELADTLLISEPLVVHHVEQLVKSGWVRRVRTGRRVTYSLEKEPAIALQKFLGNTPFFRDLGAARRT